MQDTTTTGYHLHVDLVVAEANTAKFESTVTEFLNRGGFERIVQAGGEHPKAHDAKRLVLALKSRETFEYAPAISLPSTTSRAAPTRTKARRYVHLWRTSQLRDLDLLRLMRLCAADPLYRKLDGLVLEEAQDFVARVRTPIPTDAGRPLFVRTVRHFQSFALGTYLFKIGVLGPALQAKGVVPVGHFQSITGTLNSLVEFWNSSSAEETTFTSLLGKDEPAGFIAAFAGPCDPPSVDNPGGLPTVEFREVLTPYLVRSGLKEAQVNGQLAELIGFAPPNDNQMAAQ